jgi:hypothetical protein
LDTHRRSIKIQDKKAQQQLQQQLAQLQVMENKKDFDPNFMWKGFTWKHFYWDNPENSNKETKDTEQRSVFFSLFLHFSISFFSKRGLCLCNMSFIHFRLSSAQKRENGEERQRQKRVDREEAKRFANIVTV